MKYILKGVQGPKKVVFLSFSRLLYSTFTYKKK